MANQDDYDDIPKEVPLEDDYAKDPDRVAAGHKATLGNPQTSDKAKEHSRAVLNDMGEPHQVPSDEDKQPHKEPANVAQGLKATISNPGVSSEAREHAQKRLEKEDF